MRMRGASQLAASYAAFRDALLGMSRAALEDATPDRTPAAGGLTERVFKTFPQAWWCRPARTNYEPAQTHSYPLIDPSVMADLYLEQAES
jgi:hypothetical protein